LWIDPGISQSDIVQISESKEDRFRQLLLRQGLELLPGAKDWLKRLQDDGWRQALATMTGQKNIRAIFTVLAIEPYFNAVVTGDDVREGKPAPDIFLEAAKQVGIPPGNCIVVEDAPAGVEAARRAGMRSIGVNNGKVLEADYRVHSLDQLPAEAFRHLLNGKDG
jgi:beta-phosphoglucomutase